MKDLHKDIVNLIIKHMQDNDGWDIDSLVDYFGEAHGNLKMMQSFRPSRESFINNLKLELE